MEANNLSLRPGPPPCQPLSTPVGRLRRGALSHRRNARRASSFTVSSARAAATSALPRSVAPSLKQTRGVTDDAVVAGRPAPAREPPWLATGTAYRVVLDVTPLAQHHAVASVSGGGIAATGARCDETAALGPSQRVRRREVEVASCWCASRRRHPRHRQGAGAL
jgi:hypothetical protein